MPANPTPNPQMVTFSDPNKRKTGQTQKRRNLIRLGINQGQAYAWSRSRMGGWAIAQSPILGTTITIERLKKRGYVSMREIYKLISPQLNEPFYTRPVRWCESCTGGYWTVSHLLDCVFGHYT